MLNLKKKYLYLQKWAMVFSSEWMKKKGQIIIKKNIN